MRKASRPRTPIVSILCLVAVAFGCDRARKCEADARYYEVRGIVRGFSPDRSTIEIEHENIPGFMPAMTMPFTPRHAKDIADLSPREALAFRLAVTDKEALIDNIRKIAVSEVHLPQIIATATPQNADSSSRLKEGDPMPAFGLTNESGEQISLATYKGKPFVVTFIFTRCPMPTFCPRMSKNFAALQQAIKRGSDGLAETKLLSMTIDPQNDTPTVLKEYGKAENADPAIWNFATGDPAKIDKLTNAFAVYRQAEGGTISHGLTTALIDRNGTVVKVWRGNGWTPDEVIAAIRLINE